MLYLTCSLALSCTCSLCTDPVPFSILYSESPRTLYDPHLLLFCSHACSLAHSHSCTITRFCSCARSCSCSHALLCSLMLSRSLLLLCALLLLLSCSCSRTRSCSCACSCSCAPALVPLLRSLLLLLLLLLRSSGVFCSAHQLLTHSLKLVGHVKCSDIFGISLAQALHLVQLHGQR